MSKNKAMDPKATELEDKVQTTNQKDASDMSLNVKAPSASSNSEVHEIEEPKAALNTKQAAEVVTAGSHSTGFGALTRGSATTYSGGAGNTRDDASATTRDVRPYKAGDRSGRRADSITRKVDFLDAEIIKTKIRQSKPLAETDEKQGYNGNYLNDHAITQKCSGGAPADPLFERSVDEISYDTIYYTLGQFVTPKRLGEKLFIRSWDQTLNDGVGGYEDATTFDLGSFLLRNIQVTFDTQGNITNFAHNVDDISSVGVDERVSRLSADTVRRFYNVSELDRNAMISLAGNESDPGYSCLGDSIVDATDQNRLLRLIDTLAGNIVGVSVRKTNTAGAFQVNKTAKDGARKTGPMAEMLNGCIPTFAGATHYVTEAEGIYQAFYSSENMLSGGAGLWEAVNDSLPKYTTKGKLLSLPLGPKSAVATAVANMDPLVCDPQLFELLKHNELFSTIDGPYDPLKPIVISDKIGLAHPIDPFVGCSFDEEGFHADLYTMHFENLRNKYNINIQNFFALGIYDWFVDHASRIVEHLKRCFREEDNPWTTGTKTITIPVVSSTTSFSLWDLIVCQSVPYIVERRLTTLTEILKYERNHGYPYSNVLHLKEVDVNAADNYSFSAIDAELHAGIAKPVAAMKVIMPEVFWPIAKINAQGENHGNGVGAKVVLPHYFVQNQFMYDQVDDPKTMKLLLSEDASTMAYPSTRSGTNFGFMDTIYGMSEEDYRLSLDRMTVYPAYEGSNAPGFISKIARTRGAGDEPKFSACTYKYGMSTDGLVVIPYFAYASSADNKAQALLVHDIISTPRELGLFQIAPAGLLTPARTGAITENLVDFDSSYLGLSGPGFRVKIYHAIDVTPETAILGIGTMNINNNASLENVYDVISCNRYGSNFMNGLAFNATAGRARLSPFTIGAFNPEYGTYDEQLGEYTVSEVQDTDLLVYTSQRYTFNRIQRLPFVVNPFDCNTDSLTTSTGNLVAINDEDIFDFLYMFGLCGFRASDYSELTNQRVKERIAKGMNYTIDPFVDKSMLLK